MKAADADPATTGASGVDSVAHAVQAVPEQVKGFGADAAADYSAWSRVGVAPGIPRGGVAPGIPRGKAPPGKASRGEGGLYKFPMPKSEEPDGLDELEDASHFEEHRDLTAEEEEERDRLEEEEAIREMKSYKGVLPKGDKTPMWQLPTKLDASIAAMQAANSGPPVKFTAPRPVEIARDPSPPREAPVKSKGPLMIGLESQLVDLVTEWFKDGRVEKFCLYGKCDLGVLHFSETVVGRGELIESDFDGHGIELDFSNNPGVFNDFDQQDELCVALKQDLMIDILKLNRTALDDRGADMLVSALLKNRVLKEIGLAGNQITDDGVQGLSAVLEKNPTMKVLDLHNNQIGCAGAACLAEAFWVNRSLTELDLSGNTIGDEGAGELAAVLQGPVCGVTTLNLSGNVFGPKGLRELTEAFHNPDARIRTLRIGEGDHRVLRKPEAGGPQKGPAPPMDGEKKPEAFSVECSTTGVAISARDKQVIAPIQFTQDEDDVEVTFKYGFLKKEDSRDVKIEFGKQRLKITLRGDKIIDTDLFGEVMPKDCMWTLSDGVLVVTLSKSSPGEMWPQLAGI